MELAANKSATAQAIKEMLQVFDDGRFPCPSCHEYMTAGNAPGLTAVQCPSCNAKALVPKKIANYWLWQLLGGGGMGRVYKAYRENDFDNIYAVKILARDQRDNPKLIENLRDEHRIMTEIGEHPCLVTAVECGQSGDELFMSLFYVEGERLDHLINRGGALPEPQVLFTALRLLSAETHIYKKGYLFRDLKPENIMITQHGAMLYDYGICMRIEEALQDPGDLVEGSPLYIPPERLTGEGERPHSEIYSLGMVLYHMLVGETIFQGTAIEKTAAKHVEDVHVTNLGQKAPHLHPRWEQVIDKMIIRLPQLRYQTFAEVEQELMQILMAVLGKRGYSNFLTSK